MYGKTGWFKEYYRHSLAAQGIRTSKVRRRSTLRKQTRDRPWMYKGYLAGKDEFMTIGGKTYFKTNEGEYVNVNNVNDLMTNRDEEIAQRQDEYNMLGRMGLVNPLAMGVLSGEASRPQPAYFKKKTPAWKGDTERHPLDRGTGPDVDVRKIDLNASMQPKSLNEMQEDLEDEGMSRDVARKVAKAHKKFMDDHEIDDKYDPYYAKKKQQLSEGAKVELEHKDTIKRIEKEKPRPEVAAQWIADDHNKEFKGNVYYPNLKKMEMKLEERK